MNKLRFYALIIAVLCVSISQAKKSEMSEEDRESALEEKIAADAVALGALRVGSANILVPDASSDHPMIISNFDEQPLCKPDKTTQPSRPLSVMDGFELMAIDNKVQNPKKLVIDPVNHLLVISPGQGLYSIRLDKCGNADTQQILTNEQMDQPIGHGFALFDNHLFVATSNSVYKFPYSDGQHSPVGKGVKVLTNINPNDPSASPDIAVDPFGHAFIPRSVSEVHEKLDSSMAIIKKFNLRIIPEQGFDFEKDGEVHALGTNTHGAMGFDAQARLWGINGMSSDTITRSDISANHNLASSGLAEEMNLYEFPKMNYGFPYCMTEYDLKGISASSKGLGAQWGHPTFMNDSMSLDDYCQQEENNRRPAVPLAPKSRATSVFFYMGTFCSVGKAGSVGTSVGMPCGWTDTPIITNHGLSGQAEGHNVVHLQFDDLGHKPRWDKEPEVLLEEATPCADDSCFSPYGIASDKYGRLYVSSDTTNEIFILSRKYDKDIIKKLTDTADKEAKEDLEDKIEEVEEDEEEEETEEEAEEEEE